MIQVTPDEYVAFIFLFTAIGILGTLMILFAPPKNKEDNDEN